MVLTSMVMVGAPIASADGGTDTVVVKTATGIDNPDRTFTSTVPGTQVGLFENADDATPVNACDVVDSNGVTRQGQPCLASDSAADPGEATLVVRPKAGGSNYFAQIVKSPDGYESIKDNAIDTGILSGTGSVVTIPEDAPMVNRRINPIVDRECSAISSQLKIALVMDLSGSVAYNLDTYNEAAKGIISTLAGFDDPAALALYSFGTTSPADHIQSNQETPLDLGDPAQLAQANGLIDEYTSDTDGLTNWDAALAAVDESGQTYDNVIMITDGLPDAIGANGDYTSHFTSRQLSVLQSNELKAKGTRVSMVGIGSWSVSSLAALSGDVAYADGMGFNDGDYVQSDWQDLSRVLAQLGSSLDCSVSVNVAVNGDDGDGVVTPQEGWNVNFTQSGLTGVIGDSQQASNADGNVSWAYDFSSLSATTDLDISLDVQTGWINQGATCTGAESVTYDSGRIHISNIAVGKKIDCVFNNLKSSGVSNSQSPSDDPLAGDGDASDAVGAAVETGGEAIDLTTAGMVAGLVAVLAGGAAVARRRH